MFTGIIEEIGEIAKIELDKNCIHLWIKSSFIAELKIDQSVSHNGICLTIVEIKNDIFKVTAVGETIEKTTIANWKKNDKINLERGLKLGDRLDGHLVQGHVDGKAICVKIDLEKYIYTFEIDKKFSTLIIEKGSVVINGVSLTCFNIGETNFSVAIIPYTFEHTSFKYLAENVEVNIEFDVIGKYMNRIEQLKH